jgi:hypothetical protein
VAAEVRELDCAAFGFRKLGEGSSHGLGHCSRHHWSVGAMRDVDATNCLTLFTPSPRTIGAERVERAAVRHGQQERSKRAAAPFVPVEAFPQLHEHFLPDLFGARLVAHEPACERHHRFPVAAHDHSHGGVVPATDRGDELGVFGVVEMLRRGDATSRLSEVDVLMEGPGMASAQ